MLGTSTTLRRQWRSRRMMASPFHFYLIRSDTTTPYPISTAHIRMKLFFISETPFLISSITPAPRDKCLDVGYWIKIWVKGVHYHLLFWYFHFLSCLLNAEGSNCQGKKLVIGSETSKTEENLSKGLQFPKENYISCCFCRWIVTVK